jgi:hypothetical protein
MNDIVQQLKEKAGLTEEQAIKALEVMKTFVQGKVPPMFSGFVDNFFSSAAPTNTDEFLH